MEFETTCTRCDASFDASWRLRGSSTDCPHCGGETALPEAQLGPGVIVGGYQLIEKLGQGGMGVVYLARQDRMDREVALKILSGSFSDEQAVGRFEKEVRLQAKLEHPNIVTAFDAGVDDGLHYLAMSYVRGESLEDLVARKGPLGEAEITGILREAVRALDFAWAEHRLVHRDLKPANLMRDERGSTKLMDFGVGTALDTDKSITVTGSVIGTPNYMSPEQVNGEKELDFRTDLYALGGTAYHLATGEIPFDGSSIMQVLFNQLKAELPDAREHNPELSEGFATLLKKMMAKDRDHRHASYAELLEDLDRVAKGKVKPDVLVESDPASEPEQAPASGSEPEPAKRTRWILLPVLALLGLGAGLAVKFWPGNTSPAPPTPPAMVQTPGTNANSNTTATSSIPPKVTAVPSNEVPPKALAQGLDPAWGTPYLYLTMDSPDAGPAGTIADQINVHGSPSSIKSPAGTGLRFDGVGDYIDLGTTTLSNSWTLAFWGRMDRAYAHTKFFKFSNFVQKEQMELQVHAYGVTDEIAWGGEAIAAAKLPLVEGEWSHYAVTRSLHTFTFYQDGKLVRRAPVPPHFPAGSKPKRYSYVGAGLEAGNKPDKFLDGAIDEFLILKNALTAEDIKRLAVRR